MVPPLSVGSFGVDHFVAKEEDTMQQKLQVESIKDKQNTD